MKSQGRKRGGYVLIMTLVMIAISAMTLAGFARRSLRLAMEASTAEEELQRRWGSLSCEQVVLHRAEEIFEARDTATGRGQSTWPRPAVLSSGLRLGNIHFRIVLADEDAKVNLNTLDQLSQGRNKIARLISDLHPGSSSLPVYLRPNRRRGQQARIPPFISWGQVFALEAAPVTRDPVAHRLMRNTMQITCWGSGRLNVTRASDASLAEVARLVAGDDEVTRLLELRHTTGIIAVNRSPRPSTQSDSSPRDFDDLFSDRSQSYSLWLEMTNRRGQQRHTFSIHSPQQGASGKRFVW